MRFFRSLAVQVVACLSRIWLILLSLAATQMTTGPHQAWMQDDAQFAQIFSQFGKSTGRQRLLPGHFSGPRGG